jgi:hypothetical protein
MVRQGPDRLLLLLEQDLEAVDSTKLGRCRTVIPIRMNRDVRHREKIGKVGMSINASVLALFRMSDVLGTGG